MRFTQAYLKQIAQSTPQQPALSGSPATTPVQNQDQNIPDQTSTPQVDEEAQRANDFLESAKSYFQGEILMAKYNPKVNMVIFNAIIPFAKGLRQIILITLDYKVNKAAILSNLINDQGETRTNQVSGNFDSVDFNEVRDAFLTLTKPFHYHRLRGNNPWLKMLEESIPHVLSQLFDFAQVVNTFNSPSAYTIVVQTDNLKNVFNGYFELQFEIDPSTQDCKVTIRSNPLNIMQSFNTKILNTEMSQGEHSQVSGLLTYLRDHFVPAVAKSQEEKNAKIKALFTEVKNIVNASGLDAEDRKEGDLDDLSINVSLPGSITRSSTIHAMVRQNGTMVIIFLPKGDYNSGGEKRAEIKDISEVKDFLVPILEEIKKKGSAPVDVFGEQKEELASGNFDRTRYPYEMPAQEYFNKNRIVAEDFKKLHEYWYKINGLGRREKLSKAPSLNTDKVVMGLAKEFSSMSNKLITDMYTVFKYWVTVRQGRNSEQIQNINTWANNLEKELQRNQEFSNFTFTDITGEPDAAPQLDGDINNFIELVNDRMKVISLALNAAHHTGPMGDYLYLPPNQQNTGLNQNIMNYSDDLTTLEDISNINTKMWDQHINSFAKKKFSKFTEAYLSKFPFSLNFLKF